MKKEFISSLVISLFFFTGHANGENNKETGLTEVNNKPPNVLLIIANDLTLQLGCYGDTAARTPMLDKLATEGILFERAYAAGNVCTPNRKSLLTGMNVKTVGWGNNNYMRDHPNALTLPRWFRGNGYQTVKIGSVAHTDDYEGLLDWDINLNETIIIPEGKGIVTSSYGASATDGGPVIRTRIFPDGQSTLDQIRTEMFEKFIVKEWDRSKPFFFALGFHGAHEPNDANVRHFKLHPPDRMPLTIAPVGATPMTKPFPASYRWWSINFPYDQQRLAIQGYYAAVSLMDELVGRVIAYLEKEDLKNNTIIIFVTDHGYNLGYRNNWAKHLLYPSILRVPLIVSYPGMSHKGSRSKGIVELQDIFPTLAELSNLPVPEGLNGVSFVPLMKNPGKEGKEAAFAQGILHNGSGKAVTTKNGTYMEWDNGVFREFYDLTRDPDAWFNQVDNPDYSSTIKYHKNLLESHFALTPVL